MFSRTPLSILLGFCLFGTVATAYAADFFNDTPYTLVVKSGQSSASSNIMNQMFTVPITDNHFTLTVQFENGSKTTSCQANLTTPCSLSLPNGDMVAVNGQGQGSGAFSICSAQANTC